MSDVEFDEMSVEVTRPATAAAPVAAKAARDKQRELDVEALRYAAERLRELELRLATY